MKSFRPDQTSEKKDRKEERRKKANEGKVGGGVQVCIEFVKIRSLAYQVIYLKFNSF